MKNITFTAKAWADLIEWSKSDRKIFEKISVLIEETSRTPFTGTGKPEPLRHQFKGFWSRRAVDTIILTKDQSFITFHFSLLRRL